MKKIILFILCTFSIMQLDAQNKEHRINKSNGHLIIIGIDEVTVEGHSGNEIIITSDDFDREEDERAKGLKLVNSLGLDDNTGMGLSVSEENGQTIITQISSSCDNEFELKIPAGISVEYEHKTNSGGDITVENIGEEIIISTTYGDVSLNKITGPMAVKSVYGSIEAVFTDVSQEGSISLESVYDLVDVTIPSDAKADVTLRTPYGEIYSNVDIKVSTERGMRKVSTKSIAGTINGGGVDMSLRASYDNIYLRKK